MRTSEALRVIVFTTLLPIASCVSEPVVSGRSHTHHASRTPPLLPMLESRPLASLSHGSLIANASPHVRDKAPGEATPVWTKRRIKQRILLLGATGTEPAYLHARDALDRIGVPYATLLAVQQDLTPGLLTDGGINCHFSGVIVATSGLGYADPSTGAWLSAMTPAEWQMLADFEAACDAREVTWYGWPGAEYGLEFVSVFDGSTPVHGRLTASGQGLFSRVRSNAVIPFRDAYGHRAAIVEPASTVALLESVDGDVLVALHTTSDGREALISTVDSSPYLTHSLLLEYDLIRWVTRGVFVGEKRAYLSPQIDDLFLPDDLWVVGAGDTHTSEYRINGSELAALAQWQATRIANLPAGSTFLTSLAYNAVGADPSVYPDTSLLAAALSTPGAEFLWVSHTWDHENMDAMSMGDTMAEVNSNCDTGETHAFRGLDCGELVTPEMSGLTNPSAVAGMLASGVRYVVSDTSHTEQLFPSSPGDNPSFNVGRPNRINSALYQIPRHPTNVFYNTIDPATQLDEYNTLYRSYYGRDLTYEEMLDADAGFGLYYMLQGNIDPLMFHQTNLATFVDGAGQTRSLYADWIDNAVDRFLALANVPVLTLTQAEIGRAMQARGALNECGVTATKVETTAGSWLLLQAAGNCTVPVTGVAAPTVGAVESYGGDPTTRVPMTAGGFRVIGLP